MIRQPFFHIIDFAKRIVAYCHLNAELCAHFATTRPQRIFSMNPIAFPQKIIRNFRHGIHLLKKNVSVVQFRWLTCVIVSIEVAIATVALKLFVFYLERLSFSNIHSRAWLWYPPLLCLIGIGISSFLIIRVFRKNFLKGNDKIVYAIAKKNANLPFSEMYSPLITSGITIGLGGSAGLESPIVAAGAAIGSNTGRIAFLNKREKTLLIACGITAGISTAFSAPVAGVLFAVEVLMIDISVSSFIPLLLAGAIGSLVGQVLLGEKILLSFINMRPFAYVNTPFYILLGILSGMTALYYARVFEWVENRFHRLHSPSVRWLVGSLLLGCLIILFPPLFGDGYQMIKTLADTGELPPSARSFLFPTGQYPWVTLLLISVLLLFKVFATSFTVLGGGNGGSFAPSLFIGGLLGFILGKACLLIGFQDIPLANFIVAGMAGMLSGLFFAPLTAIFLSAELTNGYSLFIPLMIVSAISFGIVRYFEPLSMEMKKLKNETDLNPLDRDLFLLSRMNLSHFIHNDFPTLSPTDSLKKIVECSHKNYYAVFAVTDINNHYIGTLYFNDIKYEQLTEISLQNSITIGTLTTPVIPLKEHETVSDALNKFEDGNQAHLFLPVVNDKGEWIGFVYKPEILEQYRKEIIDNSY